MIKGFWRIEKRLERLVAAIVRRPAESIAAAVLFTLIVGTVFYHLVEGWRILDSAYFSVITLTTIGYGDFSPQTDLGKLFTILYAFAGVGLLATYLQLRVKRRMTRHKAQMDQTPNEADDDENEVDA
jgi:hypothetical protein